jgi:hypothetical protein
MRKYINILSEAFVAEIRGGATSILPGGNLLGQIGTGLGSTRASRAQTAQATADKDKGYRAKNSVRWYDFSGIRIPKSALSAYKQSHDPSIAVEHLGFGLGRLTQSEKETVQKDPRWHNFCVGVFDKALSVVYNPGEPSPPPSWNAYFRQGGLIVKSILGQQTEGVVGAPKTGTQGMAHHTAPNYDTLANIGLGDGSTRASRAQAAADRRTMDAEKSFQRSESIYRFSNIEIPKDAIAAYKETHDPSIPPKTLKFGLRTLSREQRSIVVNDPRWARFTVRVFDKALEFIEAPKAKSMFGSWTSMCRAGLLLIKDILKKQPQKKPG